MLSCTRPPVSHLLLAPRALDQGPVSSYAVLTAADKLRVMGLRHLRVPAGTSKTVWAQAVADIVVPQNAAALLRCLLRQPALLAAARAGMPAAVGDRFDVPPPSLRPGECLVNATYVQTLADVYDDYSDGDGDEADGDGGRARCSADVGSDGDGDEADGDDDRARCSAAGIDGRPWPPYRANRETRRYAASWATSRPRSRPRPPQGGRTQGARD